MKTFEVKINCTHFKGVLSVVATSYDEAEEEALAFVNELNDER